MHNMLVVDRNAVVFIASKVVDNVLEVTTAPVIIVKPAVHLAEGAKCPGHQKVHMLS